MWAWTYLDSKTGWEVCFSVWCSLGFVGTYAHGQLHGSVCLLIQSIDCVRLALASSIDSCDKLYPRNKQASYSLHMHKWLMHRTVCIPRTWWLTGRHHYNPTPKSIKWCIKNTKVIWITWVCWESKFVGAWYSVMRAWDVSAWSGQLPL